MEIDTQDAKDEFKSLTQTLPAETAQHVLQLKVAMKNASEDEYNAVLKMLSNKPLDSEEKSQVEPEGSVTLGNTNVDGHNGHGSHEVLLETSDNDEEVGDCEENSADKDHSVDAMGQEEGKNGYDADETPLDQACVTSDTSDDPVDSVDKSVITLNEDQRLHEISNEAEEVEDDLSNTNENSADVLQESASSSEDEEEIPELLSKKADDVSSGMEFIDDEGLVERLSERVEINGTSLVEETPYLQQAPLSNSVPQSLETEITEKNDLKIDEGESSSSDDDQVVSSSPSSHSVVTSSESDLSEAAVPNDSLQVVQSDGINDDISNEEMAPGTFPINSSKDDGIAVIEDGVSHLEAKNEPESVTVPVLERTLSISSTGTQTSCENLHLAKDQSLNTFEFEYGNLDSILSGNEKGSSKLPFYYQPKIVMHGEKPVLVLQPVSSTTPSSDKNDGVAGVENGAVKASVPIILPLASPVIDKATKDAIFQQINGTTAFPSEEKDEECYTKNSFSESSSSGVFPSVTVPMSQQNGSEGDTQSNATGHDKPVYKSIPVAEKCFETSESEETENLPEWVPASELDKAFSAAAKETLNTSKEQTPVTLTFPVVSLPSTNPFAKDLAAQEDGSSDVKEESLLNFGPEQMQHSSLFGPPSSPSLSQGARPKTYQDPGCVGSATNPFVPDLTPKKQGRRREQKPADATEVVVSAEVHPSMGHPTEIHSTQPKSYRHRMSSESMVTLIETSYADTSLTSFESLGVNEPQKIAQVEVRMPQPQQESKETSQATEKPKLHVVSPMLSQQRCVCFV